MKQTKWFLILIGLALPATTQNTGPINPGRERSPFDICSGIIGHCPAPDSLPTPGPLRSYGGD